jgi:hypothetical protein
MKLNTLAAAAMGLTLAVCGMQQARAGAIATTTLNLVISTTIPTFDDYLLYFAGGTATAYVLGPLPSTGGVPTPLSYSVPGTFTTGYVTAIGLAVVGGVPTSDVVIGLGLGIPATGAGTSIASGWSSIFVTPEATVAAALSTGNTAALTAFLTTENAHSSTDFIIFGPVPATGNIAEFSSSVVGSLTVSSASAVPEPSTAVLLGFGICGVILAGTRKRWGWR